jgi:HNH endonuclease
MVSGTARLPENVQRRLWAVSMAAKYCSLIKPRMQQEQALDEVMAMAEAILDDYYGARQTHLQAMPYKEYLKTPEWRETRRAAYRRADYRCQICNASETQLNAHHRSYENRARDGEESDLIVLCATCHKRVHEFFWKVG